MLFTVSEIRILLLEKCPNPFKCVFTKLLVFSNFDIEIWKKLFIINAIKEIYNMRRHPSLRLHVYMWYLNMVSFVMESVTEFLPYQRVRTYLRVMVDFETIYMNVF